MIVKVQKPVIGTAAILVYSEDRKYMYYLEKDKEPRSYDKVYRELVDLKEYWAAHVDNGRLVLDARVSDEELNTLHNASMRILEKVGIAFHEPEAIEIFKKHGVKIDNNIVCLTESQIENALASTPSAFTINAPNPQNNVLIGGENPVFAPVFGAAFIVSRTGVQSRASMKDHDNLCKLVQTSEFIDMNMLLMVTPWDVAPETAHLHMLLSNMTLCDKAFIGCSLTRRDAIDAIEMAGILWGGKDRIRNFPIAITLISALSPLQYPLISF